MSEGRRNMIGMDVRNKGIKVFLYDRKLYLVAKIYYRILLFLHSL